MKITDQTGYPLTLDHIPQRIISLVPSITETLYALGLDKHIAAITDYCTALGDNVAGKPSAGGTKNFDFAAIQQLDPDLIIGEKEENYRDGIVALRKQYPVWTGHVNTISRALDMIGAIGKMLDRQEAASLLSREIRERLDAVTCKRTYRAAYLIWKDPYIAAGGGTFIHDMLRCCGLENTFRENDGYPRIEPASLEQADLILLASEPYCFTENDGLELRDLGVKQTILLVDGTLFSWYGYRMTLSAAYFMKIHRILAEKSLASEILYV